MSLTRFGGTWLDTSKILVASVEPGMQTGTEIMRVYMTTGGSTFMVELKGDDRAAFENYIATMCDDWTPLKGE